MGCFESVGSLGARAARIMVAVALAGTLVPAGALASPFPAGDSSASTRTTHAPSPEIAAAKARFAGTLTVLGPDDDIPGVPLGPSPQTGTLNDAAGDWLDVYSVNLTAGEILSATLSGTVLDKNRWAGLEGFAPGATSIWDSVPDFHGQFDNPPAITIHAETTGTYYLSIMGDKGAYSLAYDIAPGGPDDFIPGVALPVSPVSGSLARVGDTRDIYAIDLAADDVFSTELFMPEDAYFEAYLYGPGTTVLAGARPVYDPWEFADYLVPPDGGGTYYLVVETYWGEGDYSLEYELDSPPVHRLSGTDRYMTSIATSRATYSASKVAVLATGVSYPDALAASALAGVLDAPLLLARNKVWSYEFWQTLFEMDRLGVEQVYIVGGTSAISRDIAVLLRDDFGFKVKRLAGENRYETAREVSDEVAKLVIADGGTVDSAFLVRGDDFADALAAAPYAFSQGMPVLLTKPKSLDSLAAGFIEKHGILDVTVVGGESAVAKSVMDAAKKLNANATEVERVKGVDRYDTAAKLAAHAVDDRGWATWDYVGVATGAGFPDALSGSAAMGRRGGVLLLTGPASLSTPAREAMSGKFGDINMVLVFGGPAVVKDKVLDQIESLRVK